MTKNKQFRRTVSKEVQRRLKEQEQKQKKPFVRILQGVSWLIGLPGIIVGLWSLLPRVTVYPGEPLNESDPFSAPFVIVNEGYIELNDVRFLCSPGKVMAPNGHFYYDIQGWTSQDQHNVGTLGRNGRTTITCWSPIGVPGPIAKADIRIAVYFRPELLPWHRSIVTEFALEKDSGGRYHWFQISH